MGSRTEETVEYHDGDMQVVNAMTHYPDSTYNLAHTNLNTLTDFFKRPIVIQEFTWQTGVDFSTSFNPWQNFVDNPRISNRLSNYYLLHAKMRLKFLINGNPFYYGRLMVDYHPLYEYDNCTEWDPTNAAFIVAASQRMHIMLNPTCSKGGEMIIPYLLNTNSAVIPEGTITKNGAIHIRQIQALQASNGSTGSLTITVFASMDDVKLSIPTQDNIPSLTAQGDDEYGQGVVSQTASNVKKYTSMFKDIPAIGPYALATHMVASTVESVAKVFGYSKPVNLHNYEPIRPHYVGRVACTNDVDN